MQEMADAMNTRASNNGLEARYFVASTADSNVNYDYLEGTQIELRVIDPILNDGDMTTDDLTQPTSQNWTDFIEFYDAGDNYEI